MAAFYDLRTTELFSKYYDLLKATGYVKHDVVVKILVNAFLVDFLNTVGYYIEEEDYKLVDLAYRKLYSDGKCLMPYPVFCTKKATIGLPTMLNLNSYSFRHSTSMQERVTEIDDTRLG